MLYDISLQIDYEYANSAIGGRHLLRMLPATLPDEQTLVSGQLDIDPQPDEWIERLDFFRNTVTEVAFHRDVEEIVFKTLARVERFPRSPGFNTSPDFDRLQNEIRAHASLAPNAPHHFLHGSDKVALHPEMTKYAREAIGNHVSVLDAVQALGMKLHQDMTFDAEATTVETPVKEAFDNRHGVCQDYTHIMIACLRGLGIPAGYVSGFIRTIPPQGQTERLEGSDAMHAWVRAWCGIDMGWVEFDPTNAMFVGVDHIIIAYGRDYGDVSPVKGVLKTAGGQKSNQAVDVIPV